MRDARLPRDAGRTTLHHAYLERNRRSHSRCIRTLSDWCYGRCLRKAGGRRALFHGIREFGAHPLHRATGPLTRRRVTHHSIWGYVATESLLVRRMGHRLILLVADHHSVAMAPSFRRESTSDAHSPDESVCGRAIGVRNFDYLCGVRWSLPKRVTTFELPLFQPNQFNRE